ncbi:MAG: diacylglycerol kinase family lipid kinase [Lachnospiraceae bacterium]|jgi:YegS/Rv2252/BmrU family lipid kinase|nr:diacylglycerol kinase family lipid kinase [Lachnospiraceae bacterium]
MYHFIVNPAAKSGRGRKMWGRLEAELIRRNVEYDVYFSKREGFVTKHVEELTRNWNSDPARPPLKIVILGGDGTINETLQGVADFARAEIGYIPTGSSNDMARDLGLPKDIMEILDVILADETRRVMDIGAISFANDNSRPGRYFAVSSGIGFDAAVCAEVLTSKLKKALNKVKLGKLIYLAIALKQLLFAKRVAANIYLDENKEPIHYKKFLFAAAMVHKYEGGGFKFCPDADHTDGLLDICIVGGLPRLFLLCALPTAFSGKHFIFPGIDSYRCRSIRIEVSALLWVHTDGEVEDPTRMIKMECQQAKLTFLC